MDKSILMSLDINSYLFEFESWYKELMNINSLFYINNPKYYFTGSYRYPVKKINPKQHDVEDVRRYPALPFIGVKVFLNALRLYLVQDNNNFKDCCSSLLEILRYENLSEHDLGCMQLFDIYKYGGWDVYWYMHSDVIPLISVDSSSYNKLQELLEKAGDKIKSRLPRWNLDKRLLDFDDTHKEIIVYDYGNVFEFYYTLCNRVKRMKEINRIKTGETDIELEGYSMKYSVTLLNLEGLCFDKRFNLPKHINASRINYELHKIVLGAVLMHLRVQGCLLDRYLAISMIVNTILEQCGSNILQLTDTDEIEKFNHVLISFLDDSVNYVYKYLYSYVQDFKYRPQGIIQTPNELEENSFGIKDHDIDSGYDCTWQIIRRN